MFELQTQTAIIKPWKRSSPKPQNDRDDNDDGDSLGDGVDRGNDDDGDDDNEDDEIVVFFFFGDIFLDHIS